MKTVATVAGFAVLCGLLASALPARAETVILQDNDRDILREYVYVNYKGCPPGTHMKKKTRYFGLVKPYHSCVPDKNASITVYQPGTIIPQTVTYTELPSTVISRLPAAPSGATYVTTDTGVYLVNPQTRTVVERVDLWTEVE
jgi:hypothetical protein